ncbi:GAF-like protein [Gracilaria domingensis]|nr:GAF-like protein [Gracilaria domingensis]
MESSAQLVVDFPSHVLVFDDDCLTSGHQSSSLRLPQAHTADLDYPLQFHDNSAFVQEPDRAHSKTPFTPYHSTSDVTSSELILDNLNVTEHLNVDSFTGVDADSHSVDDSSAQASSYTFATAPDASPPPKPAVRPNVSHTRRCRAKLNSNFERLLEVLPEPPEGVEIRHKAQILQYAIDYYRHVSCKNRQLEMKLALRSPAAMHRWVQSVVTRTPSLKDALKSFMAMICLTNNWKYAELWMPQMRPGTSSILLRYLTGVVPPTVEGDTLTRLRTYRSHSRKYKFAPRTGVPGRVFLTRRPEWLPLLSDPVAFLRAPHAMRQGVEVTFAVPVIVNGSVQMVVEFFDTERRDYDPKAFSMANEIAVVFGKAFSQLRSSSCI